MSSLNHCYLEKQITAAELEHPNVSINILSVPSPRLTERQQTHLFLTNNSVSISYRILQKKKLILKNMNYSHRKRRLQWQFKRDSMRAEWFPKPGFVFNVNLNSTSQYSVTVRFHYICSLCSFHWANVSEQMFTKITIQISISRVNVNDFLHWKYRSTSPKITAWEIPTNWGNPPCCGSDSVQKSSSKWL